MCVANSSIIKSEPAAQKAVTEAKITFHSERHSPPTEAAFNDASSKSR